MIQVGGVKKDTLPLWGHEGRVSRLSLNEQHHYLMKKTREKRFQILRKKYVS